MLMARVGRWCLGLCAETECGLWEAYPESSGDAGGRPNSLCPVRQLAFQSQCMGRDGGGETQASACLGEEYLRC